jgi:hypothetical protein
VRPRPKWQVPQLDRRELLGLGGAAVLSLASSSGIDIAAAAAQRSGPILAVADPRYADSRRFAQGLAQGGARVVQLRPNAGAAWFDAITPRLLAGSRLAGLTLDSDFFILERLAEPARAVTRFVGCHDWRCRPGVSHRLRGTVTLDAVVSAIDAGGDSWAERLGLVLALTAERKTSRQEHRLKREYAKPAAARPSYLVSWLMTVTA